MRDLARLFRPESIAVIGGGAWCRSVIEQAQKIGFGGVIRAVHPTRDLSGVETFRSIADLPEPPDAAFIGINRQATIKAVAHLSEMGAGGAVCFASGFSESEAEDGDGPGMQNALTKAAGEMPLLGPNCYGFVNYLDKCALWPDQHGGQPVKSGVAIITQSSNIAINLTMQMRGLPVAFIVTAGNQAQTGLAAIGQALLADDRVTALGLHIEGIGDLPAFEALARFAAERGKQIVALKTGRSDLAQAAALSHTASVAGGDAGAQALMDRFGIARVRSLPQFLEALKILHVCGPLSSARIATVSCSGGEASLAADSAIGTAVTFPPLNARQSRDLGAALGPMVALANPLDYHTYIWRDVPAMTRVFSAVVDDRLALTILIVDYPRQGRCDGSAWDSATRSAIATRGATGANIAVAATLPELMPEDIAEELMQNGVVPLNGLEEAFAAVSAVADIGGTQKGLSGQAALLVPRPTHNARLVSEAAAKSALAAHGLITPAFLTAPSVDQAAEMAEEIGFPVVLKGVGFAHKSEAGAVALGLKSASQVKDAAGAMPVKAFLVEEMVTGVVAELLLGVIRDPAHGFVLTIGAGGTLTELLKDSVSLLIPARKKDVAAALDRLRINTLLEGYRGAPGADRPSIIKAVMALQDYVQTHHEGLDEVEINPLLCCPDRAVVADALIRREDPQ